MNNRVIFHNRPILFNLIVVYYVNLAYENSVESPGELWEASYQPLPNEMFKEFAISTKKVAGIKPSQPQGSVLEASICLKYRI